MIFGIKVYSFISIIIAWFTIITVSELTFMRMKRLAISEILNIYYGMGLGLEYIISEMERLFNSHAIDVEIELYNLKRK